MDVTTLAGGQCFIYIISLFVSQDTSYLTTCVANVKKDKGAYLIPV